jgi:hypothetical protein
MKNRIGSAHSPRQCNGITKVTDQHLDTCFAQVTKIASRAGKHTDPPTVCDQLIDQMSANKARSTGYEGQS